MRLLRTKDTAEKLGLKPVSVRKLEEKGFLHCIRDWAGHRRFREDEVEELQGRLLRGELFDNGQGEDND